MKWLRRGATVMAVLLTVQLLLAGPAGAAFEMPSIKNWIAGKIHDWTAGTNYQVEITGLGGSLPFAPHLDRLTLADQQGVWLTAEDVTLDLAWTDLFGGEIRLEDATARRLAVARLPVTPTPSPAEPFSLPDPTSLPNSIPSVALDHLQVDRIELAEPILGEPLVLALTASLSAKDGSKVTTKLDLHRVDRQDLSLQLNGVADLATKRLNLDLSAKETGGLIASLTGLSNAGDLDLDLHGDGPLADWQGKLRFDLARVAAADADVKLGLADQTSIGIDALVHPADGIVPGDVQLLIGADPKLNLAVVLQKDGSIALDRLNLSLARADVSGQARIPAGKGDLTGKLIAKVPDLTPLSTLAAGPLKGAMQATVDLSGTRERPAAALRVDGDQLGYGPYELTKLVADLQLVSHSALGQPLEGGDFDLATRAVGLDVAGVDLPDDRSLTLSAAGSAERGGEVHVDKLNVAGLGAAVDGTASMDTTKLAGDANLDANIPSLRYLAAFLPPAWRSLEGQAGLNLKLASAGVGGGDADSHLQLRLSRLNGVPAAFKDLVGKKVAVQADAVMTGGRQLDVKNLIAQAGAVALNGEGQFDLRGGPLQARLDGKMADLSDFAVLAGLPLSGSADFNVRADGTLKAPNAALSLNAAELGGLPDDLQAVIGPAPSLRAKAGQAQDGQLTLSDLMLQTAAAEITGKGSYRPINGAFSADLDGHAGDLAFLGRWLGGEPEGRATLRVDAGGTVDHPTAHLSLRAADLSGLPPKFAALIEDKATLEARAAVVPAAQGAGRVAQLNDLSLQTGAVSLTGAGSYGMKDQALAADVHAEIPDLAKASTAASTDLAGALVLDATAGGDLKAPTAVVKLRGTNVKAAGRPLGTVTADLDAKDLVVAPNGKLALAVMADRQPVTLAAGFEKNDALVELNDLKLKGPGRLRLDGGLKVDTAAPSVSGKLTGGVQNLAALRPLVGQPLEGRVDLSLQANDASGQSARASVTGSGIVVPGVIEIGSLDLKGVLADLFGKPRIDADLVAQDVSRQDVDLPRTTLSAKGPLDAVKVTLATAGNAYYPVDLDAASTIRRNGDTTIIDLAKLQGDLARKPLRLEQPAKIELRPGLTALSNLSLRYDQASLQGSAKLSGQRASGKFTLEDLQLAALQPFGAPPLVGKVDAAVGVAGTVQAPRISLEAKGQGLGVPGTGISSGALVNLNISANTTGKRVTGTMDVSGLGDAPLRLSVDAPLRLALQPFTVAVPENQSIDGSLVGSLDLKRIARLAALDGQRVEGSLNSDLTFSGTLAKPQANGSLKVANADFADVSSGAVLRDLNLTLRASGQQIAIEELRATDGNAGRLNGDGRADLGSPDLPFSASVTLTDFQPVYRDDLSMHVGGTVGIKGDKSASAVEGKFLIDRAEINIPSGGSGGGNIPVIELTGGSGVEPGAGPQATQPYKIRLDVTVDAPERIFVRGRGLESEWGGSVKAEGTAAKPVVTGQIEVKRGFINFLDRRFDITKGTVSLDGAVPPDPEVDLAASFKTSTITGILRVTGRATDPKLELTSEPPLPQDEIMAQILFGRDVSKITPVQGVQLAAALNSLRGGGPGILDKLRQGLGVDTLDVGGEGANSSIKAGKYLSDNVFLEVQQGVTPGSSKATVEVQVLPNVTVQTDVTENSQTGFGVQWKYDY